jgi:hypothetical protein
LAQWSGDPAANLLIADRTGPQVQAKVVPIPDGGFYVSWFDNATGGYDVYLQRLDAAGVEQWPHNGVLVADRGYSSTMDYGLSIDTTGNALMAFNDDRTGEAVTVARIDPDGNLVWGPDGVQVASSGTAFLGPPAVAGTSDGNIVVAWSQDDDIVVQKLDTNGAPQWGAGVLLHPTTGSYFVSDLHAADGASAILSFVTFSSRHLVAQKLGADGSLLWGAGHVQVFDGGTLQYGNFPPFVPDGAGGAVFAWYSSSPSLQCRVQRILANGSEAFTHNGVETSTNAGRLRVGPSAAFLPDTEEVVVFWTEENGAQSLWGLYGQKIDASGVRQWTDSGRELVPLSGNLISSVVTLPFADGALVAWVDSVSYLIHEPIRATRVNGDGDFVWTSPIVDLSNAMAARSDIAGALSTSGFGAFAWTNGDETTASDIPAQNLNGDGSLGSSGVFADGFESGDTSAWSATVP